MKVEKAHTCRSVMTSSKLRSMLERDMRWALYVDLMLLFNAGTDFV